MSFNQLTIVGNVGRDAEIRYTQQGVAVADFSVAVSKVTGRGDDRKEKTLWFKVTIWRERAETAVQYIKKGMKILVSGELDYSTYVDKAGQTQVSLELNARDFEFLNSREEMSGAASSDRGNSAPRGRKPKEEEEIPF